MQKNRKMTATQVFLMFLKTKCELDEYLFFKNIIMYNNGNRYFSKRRLYKNTFVEDYLSRNNRSLSNFITRLFILAPNLINLRSLNPRYRAIQKEWSIRNEGKHITLTKTYNGRTYSRTMTLFWNHSLGKGMYFNYYRRLWNKFLKENIDCSEKSMFSRFEKNKKYNFKRK